jgi:S1-C subfamily serine protease
MSKLTFKKKSFGERYGSLLIPIIYISGLFTVILPTLIGVNANTIPQNQRRRPFIQARTSAELSEQAQSFTIKVQSSESLGSGFLIKKQGSLYTVLTNAHVLTAGEPPYRIQTPDGRIWSASLPKGNSFRNNDLALLQFRSTRTYPVAALASSPSIGDEVYAAGFAFSESESSQKNLMFTTGKVSMQLPKPLAGGYQLGYTNDIQKGMSGGPLLNRDGEVVGVNGKHAYPLWENTSVFADGTEASQTLHQKIITYSWAVPIQIVVKLAPPSIQLKDAQYKARWRSKNEI